LHGVRLAARRLAVSEDGAVDPVDHRTHYFRAHGRVQLFRRGRVIEDAINLISEIGSLMSGWTDGRNSR
jgi:hypothetical protein